MLRPPPSRTRRSSWRRSIRSSTQRDYEAAKRFWSDSYIQHSAHIAPGHDGLFNLIRSLPSTLRYENQLIVAEGDTSLRTAASPDMADPPLGLPPTSCVSRTASSPSIGMFCRMRQRGQSPSAGLPMFGDRFPA